MEIKCAVFSWEDKKKYFNKSETVMVFSFSGFCKYGNSIIIKTLTKYKHYTVLWNYRITLNQRSSKESEDQNIRL